MDADLDAVATALYVKADDWLKSFPEWVRAAQRRTDSPTDRPLTE